MKSEEKEELIGGLVVAGFTALLGYGLFSLLKYLARKELSKAIQENQLSFKNASLNKYISFRSNEDLNQISI